MKPLLSSSLSARFLLTTITVLVACSNAIANPPGIGGSLDEVVKLAIKEGKVARADVAAVLVAALDLPATIGKTFQLVGGKTPVADALASAVGAPPCKPAAEAKPEAKAPAKKSAAKAPAKKAAAKKPPAKKAGK